LRENTISWIDFFFRFVTDVRSFFDRDWSGISRVGLGYFFRTDAVDLFLLYFESRDDDEVAYLVYVVRNDEVG